MNDIIKKWLFAGMGCVFFALGVIGVFLPVLPTTPFMLLALWAFARSSQRLHDYIWHHKRYGPMVRAWQEQGAIPLGAKISALVVMSVSATTLYIFGDIPTYGLLSAFGLMFCAALFILTRPTLRKEVG